MDEIRHALAELDPEGLQAVRSALQREVERGTVKDPTAYFPYHDRQQYILNYKPWPRVFQINGGSQSGKSTTAKTIVSKVVRRESPINDRLELDVDGNRTRDRWRPLTIWVATPTGEKFRRDWLKPAHHESLRHWLGDTYKDHWESPDLYYETKHGDQIIAKSYDQGYLSFESSVVDVIVLDEEPKDVRIANSCLARLATTNGCLVLAFTPLEGMSWSYHKWYAPCVERGGGVQVDDRTWHFEENLEGQTGRSVVITQMGCADNPKSKIYARELEADPTMSPAEKRARLYGEYGYVEGLLFDRMAGFDLIAPNAEHLQYIIEKVEDLPHLVAYYLIADPNYRYGAALIGIDGDDNRYVLKSHLQEGLANRQHAAVFKSWIRQLPRRPRMYADMGSAGKQSTCDLNDMGLAFSPVEKPAGSVSQSIKIVRGWLWPDPKHIHPVTGESPAPRLYFLKPGLEETWEEDGMRVCGSRLCQQLATARRMEGEVLDSIHKDQENSFDLFDCVRYGALMIPTVREFNERSPQSLQRRMPEHRKHRLPTYAELEAQRPEPAVHPIDQEIYCPDVVAP